jgi:hypothetical protein
MNSLENVRLHLDVSETEKTTTMTLTVKVSKNTGLVTVNGTPMGKIDAPAVTTSVVSRYIAQLWEVFVTEHLPPTQDERAIVANIPSLDEAANILR